MTREELLKSPAYWTTEMQMALYRQIESYMCAHGLNKTQLAEHLGCTKGYVTQLLNGDFDHKMSKLVELALAVGKIPEIKFSDVDEYIASESQSYSGMTVACYTVAAPVYESSNQKDYQSVA